MTGKNRPPTIYTQEVLASIPDLIAQGLGRDEIAVRLGVTTASLQVTCCKKKISLRRNRALIPRTVNVVSSVELPPPSRPHAMRLSKAASFLLHLHAEKRASNVNALAKKLLETIAKDNLFDAVLDEETA
jgi:hypothetical protein